MFVRKDRKDRVKVPSVFQRRYLPKPCPFCGGEADATYSQFCVTIRCVDCGAAVSSHFCTDKVSDLLLYIDDAVSKWEARCNDG